MKALLFLGKVKCRLGIHKTAGLQILWNRTNPKYGGTRLKCIRCDKIIEEMRDEM